MQKINVKIIFRTDVAFMILKNTHKINNGKSQFDSYHYLFKTNYQFISLSFL